MYKLGFLMIMLIMLNGLYLIIKSKRNYFVDIPASICIAIVIAISINVILC